MDLRRKEWDLGMVWTLLRPCWMWVNYRASIWRFHKKMDNSRSRILKWCLNSRKPLKPLDSYWTAWAQGSLLAQNSCHWMARETQSFRKRMCSCSVCRLTASKCITSCSWPWDSAHTRKHDSCMHPIERKWFLTEWIQLLKCCSDPIKTILLLSVWLYVEEILKAWCIQ